jgi:hypothetical protein
LKRTEPPLFYGFKKREFQTLELARAIKDYITVSNKHVKHYIWKTREVKGCQLISFFNNSSKKYAKNTSEKKT